MEEAIQFYLYNNTGFLQTANKFNVSMCTLSRKIKEKYPNYRVLQFVNVSNHTHNNKYDYSMVETFSKVLNKVPIVCPEHGVFKQTVFHHMRGANCPKCSYKITATKKTHSSDKFIEIARFVHGDKYDYSKVNYVSNRTDITIICKHHGDFIQKPDDHKQGKGCYKCGRENTGWTKTLWKKKANGRSAKLYIIRCYNEEESFIKIGRTFNSVQRRFGCKSDLPYSYEEVEVIESDDFDFIYDLEIHLHRTYKHLKYVPDIFFWGFTECFTIDALDNIKQTINNFKNAKPT